jgi:hypothetical protein
MEVAVRLHREAEEVLRSHNNSLDNLEVSKSYEKAKAPAPKAAKPAAKRYIGESHDYDSNRPKKPVRSRYNGAAGAAY